MACFAESAFVNPVGRTFWKSAFLCAIVIHCPWVSWGTFCNQYSLLCLKRSAAASSNSCPTPTNAFWMHSKRDVLLPASGSTQEVPGSTWKYLEVVVCCLLVTSLLLPSLLPSFLTSLPTYFTLLYFTYVLTYLRTYLLTFTFTFTLLYFTYVLTYLRTYLLTYLRTYLLTYFRYFPCNSWWAVGAWIWAYQNAWRGTGSFEVQGVPQ